MTMKFLNDVRAEITSLFADNVAGAITAASLRQVVNDIVDSAAPPDCAILSTASAVGQAVGTAKAIVPMGAAISSNPIPAILSGDASTRRVTMSVATSGFLCSIVFEATVDNLPNNQVLEFQVFQNGVATRWTAECVGRGAGRPSSIDLVGRLVSNGTPIDVRVSSPTATNCDFITCSLVVQLVPTNAPL